MPEDPNRFPRDPEPTPPVAGERNTTLWAGMGCLGVMVLSFCLLSYWAQTSGFRWILKQGDETRGWASRVVLTGALESIRSTCIDGVASEDAQTWFHSDLPSAARNLLCSIDDEAIQRIATPPTETDLSTPWEAETLASIGEPEAAVRLGMDPALCYRYASETIRIIGCFQLGPESETIPYEIIDVRKVER